KVLEMVAKGDSIDDVFNFVTLALEKQATVALRSSIQLLDDDGKRLQLCVAPSLPESCRRVVACCFVDSQDGPSALAASLKQPVIVPDLAAAPEWADIADALRPCGGRAVWAMPIISSRQKTLGCFCLYLSKPRAPSAAHQAMLENVAQTLALV